MSRDHVPMLLLVSAALVAGCPLGSSDPPPPTPIEVEGPEVMEVSLASVEASVPAEIPTYEAWQVQRQGGMAIALVIERFVRGQCFESQLYSRMEGGGYFVRDGASSKGRRQITPATEQRAPALLLTQALDKESLPYADNMHVARHGLQRPAWSFARVEAKEGGQPIEVTTEFGYDLSACSLPPRIEEKRVPAPRATSVPTMEVIERGSVTWAETRGERRPYIRGLTRGLPSRREPDGGD